MRPREAKSVLGKPPLTSLRALVNLSSPESPVTSSILALGPHRLLCTGFGLHCPTKSSACLYQRYRVHARGGQTPEAAAWQSLSSCLLKACLSFASITQLLFPLGKCPPLDSCERSCLLCVVPERRFHAFHMGAEWPPSQCQAQNNTSCGVPAWGALGHWKPDALNGCEGPSGQRE